MGLLDFLHRRSRPDQPRGGALLPRLEARVPPDGAPGLVPAPDAEEAAREVTLGERFAAEFHAFANREPLGLARRVAAVASAAGRHRPDELAEALEGLAPWDLPALLTALDERTDLPRRALLETCRRLLPAAGSWEVLAAALGLLALEPAEKDLAVLRLAARSPALAGPCAIAAESLGPGALLDLARVGTGLGRALLLERLGLATAESPAALAPLAAEAFRLAGAIEDGPSRAYAAVPLLEVADAPALLQREPALAEALASCVAATALGGWNGGPGPGLGRLPGAIRTAEALLAEGLDQEVRLVAARAVLEAHPMPPGPVRQAAEKAAG